ERDCDLLSHRHAHALYTRDANLRKSPLPSAAFRELFRQFIPLLRSPGGVVTRSSLFIHRATVVAWTLFACAVTNPAGAQRPRPPTGAVRPYTPVNGATMPLDSVAYAGLHWRELGPFRGGRSVAVTGNPQRPNEFWMGTTGGGVFKSVNGGVS